jgi:hypothetical protein
VPLLVRWPGGRPQRRVAAQVRTMDVFPTVLDALALPSGGLDGVSLLPLVHGGRARARRPRRRSPSISSSTRERKAVGGRMKMILDPASGAASLFDLRADPTEQRDVAAARRPTRLRARLEHRLRATLEGFHLLVRGGRDLPPAHGRLRTATGFRDVGLYNPEGADRFTLSADGRVLEVELDVAGRVHRPFFGVDVDDDDGVDFRSADGAEVEMAIRMDDAPLPADRLALGADGASSAGAGPWRFAPGDARLGVPFPIVPAAAEDGALRAALFAVHRPPPPVATLDVKTRENLRALGYID